MNIIQRFSAPTPSFFRKLRNVALVLTAVSGSLLAAPVVLPALVVQLASYLAVAGSVAMAVSQATTDEGSSKPPGDYAP
jgi:energy-converting hydrogenase Eha subunit G